MNLYEKVKTLAGAEYRKFADTIRSDGQRYGIYPLGNNQKGIWSVTRIDAQKENPYYNPIFKIVFDGGDPERIKKSAENLWNSQDIFRFRYFELDGEPYQYLDRDAVFDIEYIESANEAEAQKREKEFCLRNFDLFNEYPIRFRILKMVRLCDYVPVLKSEITFDDGSECRKAFEVGAVHSNGTTMPTVTVTADEMSSMKWLIEKCGSLGSYSPANNTPSKIRHAIMSTKANVEFRTVYSQTGWR